MEKKMMDYSKLTVGEKFDHDMPDESMSIIVNGGAPMLTDSNFLQLKRILLIL